MAIDPKELDEFYDFVKTNAANGGAESLEEALHRFRIEQDDWKPKSPLGRRLKELREKFVTNGGHLLTTEQVDADVRDRRGSTFSEE